MIIRPLHLHPDDVLFFREVGEVMIKVARKYNLPLRLITGFENPEAPAFYGQCFGSGEIQLTLRFKVKGEWTDPRREEDVWRTAAHELAHLRHMNHGVAFQEFEEEMRTAVENAREDHTQKILRKLVKLQAARDSEAAIGNAEAAEAFAGMINKMLVENELSPSDIDYARRDADDPVIELEVHKAAYGIKHKKSRIAWEEKLARIVANAHLCSFLIRTGRNDIIFVGTKSHATVAEYAYGTLVPAAEKLADKEYYNYHMGLRRRGEDIRLARGFRPAWLDAFVSRIDERFKDARKAAVAASVTNPGDHTMALMRLDKALVKTREYIDDKFGRRGKGKNRFVAALNGGARYHKDGREWGRAAADRMTIGQRGVTGGKSIGSLGEGRG